MEISFGLLRSFTNFLNFLKFRSRVQFWMYKFIYFFPDKIKKVDSSKWPKKGTVWFFFEVIKVRESITLSIHNHTNMTFKVIFESPSGSVIA